MQELAGPGATALRWLGLDDDPDADMGFHLVERVSADTDIIRRPTSGLSGRLPAD